jgi:DNA-binding GntR family transcriptional regulator
MSSTPTTRAAIDPFEAPTLAEQAYRRIEESIITLELAPGSFVSEARLSARLEIGRTPVREALQRLAAEHLVTVVPKRGVMISNVHVEQHLLALEARRALEEVVVVGAARRSSEAERARFRALATEMEAAARDGDEKRFLALDGEFNAFCAACARNLFAEQAITPLHALSRRYWYIHQRQHGDIARSARLHADLMRAIADGDDTAALAASDALMVYAEAVTREVIRGDGPPTHGDVERPTGT